MYVCVPRGLCHPVCLSGSLRFDETPVLDKRITNTILQTQCVRYWLWEHSAERSTAAFASASYFCMRIQSDRCLYCHSSHSPNEQICLRCAVLDNSCTNYSTEAPALLVNEHYTQKRHRSSFHCTSKRKTFKGRRKGDVSKTAMCISVCPGQPAHQKRKPFSCTIILVWYYGTVVCTWYQTETKLGNKCDCSSKEILKVFTLPGVKNLHHR